MRWRRRGRAQRWVAKERPEEAAMEEDARRAVCAVAMGRTKAVDEAIVSCVKRRGEFAKAQPMGDEENLGGFHLDEDSGAAVKGGIGNEGFSSELLQLAGCGDALNPGSFALLQRVDRLDNILSAMEDKLPTEQSISSSWIPLGSGRPSSGPPTPSSLEKRCKPAESVLEEVEEKGTLVERVSELEKRVLKLQGMISTKSGSDFLHPVVVVNAVHSTGPHAREAAHIHDHDQHCLQELIDVEKHEVIVTSTSTEHNRYPELCVCCSKNTADRREVPHIEGNKGMVSSEGASTPEQEPPIEGHQSNKKFKRIKKWLSKRCHVAFSDTTQDKNTFTSGHCWNPYTKSRHCWNVKKGMLHPSPDAHCDHNLVGDESP